MKLLGWALILVGGGIVVYGARKLSAPPSEPGDPDYEPEDQFGELDMTEDEFDAQVRQATDPSSGL